TPRWRPPPRVGGLPAASSSSPVAPSRAARRRRTTEAPDVARAPPMTARAGRGKARVNGGVVQLEREPRLGVAKDEHGMDRVAVGCGESCPRGQVAVCDRHAANLLRSGPTQLTPSRATVKRGASGV